MYSVLAGELADNFRSYVIAGLVVIETVRNPAVFLTNKADLAGEESFLLKYNNKKHS